MENANVGQLATVEPPQIHTDHEPRRLAKLAVISLVCQHFSRPVNDNPALLSPELGH